MISALPFCSIQPQRVSGVELVPSPHPIHSGTWLVWDLPFTRVHTQSLNQSGARPLPPLGRLLRPAGLGTLTGLAPPPSPPSPTCPLHSRSILCFHLVSVFISFTTVHLVLWLLVNVDHRGRL